MFSLIGCRCSCARRLLMLQKAVERFAAILQEEHWCEEGVEQGCRGKTSKNRDRNGVQDFGARSAGRKEEWDQGETCGKRCHQNWCQTLQASSNDKLPPKAFPLVHRKIDVVTNFKDPVTSRNACESNKSDHARDGELQAREIKRDHASNEGK